MFLISQYLINKNGTCDNINKVSVYSIISGVILYAVIYLYLLFYNEDLLVIFNKYIIYIVIIDLILSTFYYLTLPKRNKINEIIHNIEKSDYIKNEETESESNVSEMESEMESELDEELEEEIEKELENKEIIKPMEHMEHMEKEMMDDEINYEEVSEMGDDLLGEE